MLAAAAKDGGGGAHQADVLNGIAWDPEKRRLFVTGKLWNRLYEIELVARGGSIGAGNGTSSGGGTDEAALQAMRQRCIVRDTSIFG